MANIAFIGLGVMGFPMAGHLVERGGHRVTVYNRTKAKAESWVERFGGSHAATPQAAAVEADIVFACVGNDKDLYEVANGPAGAFQGMKPGTLFIDHTTASAHAARALHQAAGERGLHFLDAPVSGGQAGAEKGMLTIMVGGDSEPFQRAEPIMASYARMIGHIGPSGSGQLAKMVNQIAIAGLVQGLSEAIHFAKRSKLDVAKVIEVIAKGAAQSWQMENRWKTMDAGVFDFGFAVDWMRKDLGIVLDEAKTNGARLPVTALVDQFYADVQAMGGGRFDTSSLISRLEIPPKPQ